jgi:16S rRNA (cytosine1402-N4)-methyltransferase
MSGQTPCHLSVLLDEVVQAFDGCCLKTFVDGTLGAGGHAEAILQAHPEIERYIGIDQDPEAIAIARERLAKWKNKLEIVSSNFSKLEEILHTLKIDKVEGILLDLGVSSMQLDRAEKGFSFMREGPLDMRMDPDNPLTAKEIINTWGEGDLARIFRDLGEEKKWRIAAREIVKQRGQTPFNTTKDLADFLKKTLYTNKKGIHPATQIFQALRIKVNNELGVIETALPIAIDWLAPKGRLAVISFHSLEDRLVKNITRFSASDKMDTSGIGVGLFRDKERVIDILTRKAIIPTDEEISRNPRSRSAKLRVIEKR